MNCRKTFTTAFIFLAIMPISMAWWDNNWNFRQPIAIDNSLNNNTLTDYQVAINISHSDGMNDDFSDIRFTWLNSTDGRETEIPYWIESRDNSSWAYVWVKVKQIPVSSTTTIYMYYGNTSLVSSQSSINNTALNGWGIANTSYTIDCTATFVCSNVVLSNGYLTGNNLYVYSTGSYSGSFQSISVKSQQSTPADEMYDIITDYIQPYSWWTFNFYRYGLLDYGTHIKPNKNEVDLSSLGYTAGTDVKTNVTVTSTWIQFWDSVNGNNYNDTNNVLGTNRYVGMQTGIANISKFRWWFIKKYSYPEPTYSFRLKETVLLI